MAEVIDLVDDGPEWIQPRAYRGGDDFWGNGFGDPDVIIVDDDEEEEEDIYENPMSVFQEPVTRCGRVVFTVRENGHDLWTKSAWPMGERNADQIIAEHWALLELDVASALADVKIFRSFQGNYFWM